MYEVFEHTADLGLRIRADGLDGLFEEAARALFSVIITNPEAIRPAQAVDLAVEGDEYDELLHDWLAELLYTFHASHLVLSQFKVEVGHGGLTATARGEPIDLDRHEIETEVKAVTYHGLRVERDGTGWLAEVIVDI